MASASDVLTYLFDISITPLSPPLPFIPFLSDIFYIKKEKMKIKKEEDIKEEGIEKEKIKKEEEEEEEKEEDVLESSFRASLSRFAYPSSPPSSTRRQPPLKRPSPDSNPNNDHTSPSVSLTLTVAVAQSQSTPPVVTVQHGNNNDESVQTLLLRRSPRKRKGGENHQCLDTGGGGGGDGGGAGTRPSKKMRRGGRRAPEVDLSHLPHLGALPEYLAEDLDGAFLFLHQMIVCPLDAFPLLYPPSYFPLGSPPHTHSALLRNQVREIFFICFCASTQYTHKAQGARPQLPDTTTQMALTIFGRACISPVK